MAIATLDKVYNNKDVFSGVVKVRGAQAHRHTPPPLLLPSSERASPLSTSHPPCDSRARARSRPPRSTCRRRRRCAQVRKGLAVKMIMTCGSLPGIKAWFYQFASEVKARTPVRDPSAARRRAAPGGGGGDAGLLRRDRA